MTNNNHQVQHRLRDWQHYNKALIQRGSLTVWVEQRTLDAWRDCSRPTRRGRRRTYTDLGISCALTLREVYGLPLRSTQGLVSSLLRLLKERAGITEGVWSRLP